MPYISKIETGRRYLDFVAQHKKVMSYFPHTEKEDARSHWNVLWREENGFILVQSEIPPKEIQSLEVGEKLDLVIQTGNFISYRVRMNSVKDLNGKKIRLTNEEIPAWWDRKLDLIGVKTLNDQVDYTVERNKSAMRKDVKLYAASVLIVGRAEIIDSEKFRSYFISGVGRMKSYGFGLMSINRYNP